MSNCSYTMCGIRNCTHCYPPKPIEAAQPVGEPELAVEDQPCEWYGRDLGRHDWISLEGGWLRCTKCKRQYKPVIIAQVDAVEAPQPERFCEDPYCFGDYCGMRHQPKPAPQATPENKLATLKHFVAGMDLSTDSDGNDTTMDRVCYVANRIQKEEIPIVEVPQATPDAFMDEIGKMVAEYRQVQSDFKTGQTGGVESIALLNLSAAIGGYVISRFESWNASKAYYEREIAEMEKSNG